MSLTNAPRLETQNLILRGPKHSDADPLIAFMMNKERAKGFGYYDNRPDAWRWFALSVGHWHIHGYGYFTIVEKASDKPAGVCGIWNPEGWPEPEMGWVVFGGFEGKGIAFEAASRVRQWAYQDLGLPTLTSNIVPDNTRSKTLAERLGAKRERLYDNAHMGQSEMWRHPAPAEVLS